MIPSRYTKTQVKRCPQCGLNHLTSLNCQNMKCFYCLGIHNIKDYKEGMCPYAYYSTQQLRQKNMLVCHECRGLGSYKHIEHIKIEEREDKFQQRVAEWKKYLRQNSDEPQPQKMTFETKNIEKNVTCTLCEGEGLVKQIKFCCLAGCSSCNFQGNKQSSAWTRLKIQSKKISVPLTEETQCSICLETVPANEPTYSLDCVHRYHRKCILQYFTMQTGNKSCPNCRGLQKYYPYGNKPLSLIQLQDKNSSFNNILNQENVITKYRRSRSRDQPKKRQTSPTIKNKEREEVRLINNLPEENKQRIGFDNRQAVIQRYRQNLFKPSRQFE